MMYDSQLTALILLACVETIIIKVTKVPCQGKNNENSLRHFNNVSTQTNEIKECWSM